MLKTTEFIKTKSFKIAIYAKGSIKADKLALVMPGKLDTKDYSDMRGHVNFLATKGYFALSFDPPGTWESDGDITIYTMSNYFKAINEIIEYYGNKPTFLVGHSRGANMAIFAGITNRYVTSFVSVMGNATFNPVIKKHYPNKDWETKGYQKHIRDTPPGYSEKEKVFKLPYTFLEDEIQYDMLDDLSKCKKPKLFIVCSQDIAVKIELVQNAYNISSEPKQIQIINSGHDYRKSKELIEEVNVIIGKFLEEK
jgi:pimeloyl-ACP methyl ester carboxylesterase